MAPRSSAQVDDDDVVDLKQPVDLDLDELGDDEIRPFVISLFGEQWSFEQPTLGKTMELDSGKDAEDQIELVFGEHWPKVSSRVLKWRGTKKINMFMYSYRLHFGLGDAAHLKKMIADLNNPSETVKPNRADRRAGSDN